jgi:nucleotide-binding universal stress UspA family protein
VLVFRHILVPIDLSDRNDRAVRTAFEIAESTTARVTLLHVTQRVSGIAAVELKSFYEQLKAKAQARLSAVIRRHAQPGTDVRGVVVLGDPARDIVRWAERNRADIIVIGSHSVEPGRGPQLGWGTTSYKVALLCRCPVLLVKATPSRVRRARSVVP